MTTRLEEQAAEYIEALHADRDAGEFPLLALARTLEEDSPSPQVPKVGQLWRIRSADQAPIRRALAVLTCVGTDFRAVLASDQTWMATEDDHIVEPELSPTGEALLLHLWRDVPVAPAALETWIGDLQEPTVDALLMHLQHLLTGGFVLRALTRLDLVDGVVCVGWTIALRGASDAPLRLVRGTRILHELDPRREVQRVVTDVTSWVEADALAAVPDADSEHVTQPWWRLMASWLLGPGLVEGKARAVSGPVARPDEDAEGDGFDASPLGKLLNTISPNPVAGLMPVGAFANRAGGRTPSDTSGLADVTVLVGETTISLVLKGTEEKLIAELSAIDASGKNANGAVLAITIEPDGTTLLSAKTNRSGKGRGESPRAPLLGGSALRITLEHRGERVCWSVGEA